IIDLARSTTSSMLSLQAPVERYFHPSSATMVTIVAVSSSAMVLAHFTAPDMIAPEESPTKSPTSAKRRVHSIDSFGRTTTRRSSSSAPLLSMKIGGMYPSSRLRSPSTISPAGGSTAGEIVDG